MNGLKTLTLIAERNGNGYDVVAWGNGFKLLGRTSFSSRDDAGRMIEWSRDMMTPLGIKVNVFWPQ